MSGYILSNGFKFAIYIYFLLYDWRMIAIYWTIIGIYTIIHFWITDKSAHSGRLKLRQSHWSAPCESNVYVKMEVPIQPFEKYAAEILKKTGTKITLTHICLKSIGHAMSQVPGINGKIIFGNFVPFKTVDVNTLVDLDGKDLAQTTVVATDLKTIEELAIEVSDKIKHIKTGKNKVHAERTKLTHFAPDWVMAIVSQLIPFITYNLGMDFMKMKADGLGGFLLTNVSGLGYKEAYAPIVDFTRNSCSAIMCAPFWTQKYDENGENGKVIKVCNFMWTCDHRFMDGGGAGNIVKFITEVFENPQKFQEKLCYYDLVSGKQYPNLPCISDVQKNIKKS